MGTLALMLAGSSKDSRYSTLLQRELTAEEHAKLAGPHRSTKLKIGKFDVLKAASFGLVGYGVGATFFGSKTGATASRTPSSGYEYLGSRGAQTLSSTGVAATKEWTISSVLKEYGGTALKLLAGSSPPSTKAEANETTPFNYVGSETDYAMGYGLGGGMGGGGMLTTEGEQPYGLLDEVMENPIYLWILGAIIAAAGYFFFFRR